MVKHHLTKAREAALQAIEIYNKPGAHFRSGGYVVLMVIAWTSLFHAVFYRRGQKPWTKGKNGRFIRVDSDPKHWELDECLDQYYGPDTGNPVRKNLEFFIKLRNRIEHRWMPELDASIFGECQAMVLNFDEFLGREFGDRYTLRESLSFALQLFPATSNLGEAVLKSPVLKSAAEFVEGFRSALAAEVLQDSRFAFKAFLIEVKSHESKSALAIQWVKWDELSTDEQAATTKYVALVKNKEVPVVNADRLKAGDVVKRVETALGNPTVVRNGKTVPRFTQDAHTRAWKHFTARPTKGTAKPSATKPQWCSYDKAHGDYVYTEAWVKHLAEFLSSENGWASLYPKAQALGKG
jgi:hypothetical protein